MDESIEGFYTKNAAQGYKDQYEKDHGPRLDAMVAYWNLREELKGKRVLDVGGGLGFLGKRFDLSTDYWVIDGAKSTASQRLAKGHYCLADIDRDLFGSNRLIECSDEFGPSTGTLWPADHLKGQFDAAFILETLEHCIAPYNVLVEVKKLVKEDGDIYISLPHQNVWHNAIYPALLWPEQNWEQFLGQMALPIAGRWFWDRGWNARHWKCKNRPYREKVMLYEKSEPKFRDANPQQMVNW